MAVDLILNVSLIFALVGAPVFLAAAFWYRRSLGRPTFVWPISEMVVVTIVYFITSLLLFIVGVSCFFSHWGYLDAIALEEPYKSHFFYLGISSLLFLGGLSMFYLGLRKLLVQVVVPEGVIMNERLVPLPNSLKLIPWENIVDYYVVADYPNVVMNFIIKDETRFSRHAIKVPIYLKDEFEEFIDKQIYTAQTYKAGDTEISAEFFSEN